MLKNCKVNSWRRISGSNATPSWRHYFVTLSMNSLIFRYLQRHDFVTLDAISSLIHLHFAPILLPISTCSQTVTPCSYTHVPKLLRFTNKKISAIILIPCPIKTTRPKLIEKWESANILDQLPFYVCENKFLLDIKLLNFIMFPNCYALRYFHAIIDSQIDTNTINILENQ